MFSFLNEKKWFKMIRSKTDNEIPSDVFSLNFRPIVK